MDHLEEIRARLSIEDLVGGYVQLKKAGRSMKGLCPFHSEKTPSFVVSPDKGIAYCFGCNRGGDIFRFTELVENVDFREAVKLLANKVGVKVPEVSEKQFNKRARLIDIHKAAISAFQDNLANHPKHKQYLLDRGLTEESIERFQLGYAEDDYHHLKNALTAKGYAEEELIEAGLLSQRSMADKTSYDRFRGRMMFPIFDHQGNPIGFGGRIMGDGEPKYLNSPDTPLYNKSLVLYGLNWAKEAIKENDLVIVTEGYMDTLMPHQAGTPHVVATSGTALTVPQIKLLKRFTPNIAFAFDQDEAGLHATQRAIELSQELGVNLKVVRNPLGKDPADCILEAPEEWLKAAKNPISVMDFHFEYAFRTHDAKSLTDQKEILTFLLPLIKLHSSRFEQDHYLNRLAQELRTDSKILWEDLKRLTPRKKFVTPATESVLPVAAPRSFNREEFLLGLILAHPGHYEAMTRDLLTNVTFNPTTEKFYIACKNVYTAEGSFTVDSLKATLNDEDRHELALYQLLIEEHYPDFPEEMILREASKLVHEINRTNLQMVQKRAQHEIRETKSDAQRLILLNQYNEILKLKAKLH